MGIDGGKKGMKIKREDGFFDGEGGLVKGRYSVLIKVLRWKRWRSKKVFQRKSGLIEPACECGSASGKRDGMVSNGNVNPLFDGTDIEEGNTPLKHSILLALLSILYDTWLLKRLAKCYQTKQILPVSTCSIY